MRLLLALPLLAAAFAETGAMAAERGFSVTDFDRIRIEGPYEVKVRVGPPAAAHATGTTPGLDRTMLTVSDGTLIVRTDHQAWGGSPGGSGDGRVVVYVTVPTLRAASLSGSGALHIDHMRGLDLQLSLAGSGALDVAALDGDAVTLVLGGSGAMKIAGRARQATVMLQGSGALDAAGLSVGDASITAQGSGSVSLAALHSAKVTSAGSGDVTVTGDPACTVANSGSGEVRCGRGG